MDPQLTWFLHLVGVMFLFFGLGMLYMGAVKNETSGFGWKIGNIITGVGLLLTFLLGFARMHTVGWPLWGFAKLAFWLVLAAAPVLMKKGPMKARLALILVLIAGTANFYLVYYRPF